MPPNVGEMNGAGSSRREAILGATLRLVGEGGTGAVTHRAVADEAGVAVGLITYYFSTTESLLAAALQRAGEQERNRLLAFAPPPGAAPDDWVNALVNHLAVNGPDDRSRKLAAFELMLQTARDPELRSTLGEWAAAYLELATAALGAAGSKDAAADARLLVAALLGLDLSQVAAGGLPVEHLRGAIASFIDRLADGAGT